MLANTTSLHDLPPSADVPLRRTGQVELNVAGHCNIEARNLHGLYFGGCDRCRAAFSCKSFTDNFFPRPLDMDWRFG